MYAREKDVIVSGWQQKNTEIQQLYEHQDLFKRVKRTGK
jgi:hypothetical protein